MTDYEKYIRTEELLGLQKPNDQLACEDELTFQMIHQIAELHFKLIIHYLHIGKKCMIADDITAATSQLRRINLHLKHLPEIFVMVTVINPIDYHTIRLALGRGSGQDSPGFNKIIEEGPTLWGPFELLLKKRQLTLLQLHQKPREHHALFLLMQELIQFREFSEFSLPSSATCKAYNRAGDKQFERSASPGFTEGSSTRVLPCTLEGN